MQTDAHNMGREERRALLEQRCAAVARQLRRLRQSALFSSAWPLAQVLPVPLALGD